MTTNETRKNNPAPCVIGAFAFGCICFLIFISCVCIVAGIYIILQQQINIALPAEVMTTPTMSMTSTPEFDVESTITKPVSTVQPPTSTVTFLMQPLTKTVTQTVFPSQTPTSMFGIGSIALRQKDSMEMVYMPASSFVMGSDDGKENEKPAHNIYLSAYWIDRYEVSNAQYKLCVAVGDCAIPGERDSMSRDVYYKSEEFANYPVIYVSWYQAQNYCEWVGGSLPTEAQWEKAARGAESRKFPWGEEPPSCELTNYIDPDGMCIGDTVAVDSYPETSSPYGAMNMSGNVAEWVYDWYHEGFYRIRPNINLVDPTGPRNGEYKVVRGGSWSDGPFSIRTTFRDWMYPEDLFEGSLNIGFRCAFSENIH